MKQRSKPFFIVLIRAAALRKGNIMKSIKVIWRDKTHKVFITPYDNVHSFSIVEDEGKRCLRVYIDDAFGGETATFDFDEILSVEL